MREIRAQKTDSDYSRLPMVQQLFYLKIKIRILLLRCLKAKGKSLPKPLVLGQKV